MRITEKQHHFIRCKEAVSRAQKKTHNIEQRMRGEQALFWMNSVENIECLVKSQQMHMSRR